jgi:hypothetical protein
MQMQYAIDVPQCGGINHADFSPDGRYAMFTCEFAGSVPRSTCKRARSMAT